MEKKVAGKEMEREPYVKEGYFRNAVMAFFLCVLNFFDEVKKACRMSVNVEITYSKRCRRICSDSSISSEELLNILLDFYRSGAEQIQINGEQVTFTQVDQKMGYFVTNNVEQDISTINDVIHYVDSLFLEETLKNSVKYRLEKLLTLYEQNENEIHVLWHRETIGAFLDQYYEILRCFACEDDVLRADGVSEYAVKPLLNLGIRTTDDGRIYAQMTAPLVLSALHLIYQRLDEYLELDYDSELSDLEMLVYHEIFLAKIFQIFRFPLIVDECDDLCQAALPAYQREADCELRIPIRSLSTYNSFQGIRELRLGEKIIFEFRNMLNAGGTPDSQHKYSIVLIGDIAEEPLKELISYVEERLRYYEGELPIVKLEYIVYTVHDEVSYNELHDIGTSSCYIFKKEANIFENSIVLERVMNEGDLIFYLDYYYLYQTEIQPIQNYLIFKQSYALDSYYEYYKRIQTNDMFLKCKYTDLYQMLTAYVWRKQLGIFRKQAREDVIQYIKKYVMASGKKTVYLYISDIDAFKQLRCVQEYMVRIEKYKQKQIGIVRFAGNEKREPLLVSSSSNNDREAGTGQYLQFNMWQFVKHNVINQMEEVQRIFQKGESYDTAWLNQIIFYIDYSDWRNEVKISWLIEGEDKERFCVGKLEPFIKLFFEKPFENENLDMYSRYIKNTYVSFLYGNARSIEDLLFLHILKTRPELIGDIVFVGRNDKPVVSYTGGCKYSHKKIFWEVIEEMDQSAPSPMGEYVVLEKVKQDSMYAEAIEREDAAAVTRCLTDILRACEGVGYETSALYTNCNEKLDNN